MTTEQRVAVVALNFEQRQRAEMLMDDVVNDPSMAACELIRLRDIIASIADMLSPITHPDTKAPIGYHMCFVRDADVPTLKRIAANGEVQRD